jgi:two-component system OmpR family response regulator
MQKTPRLLVVDDDGEIRSLLSNLLSNRGYRVKTARDEQEMRRILNSSRIDLVILDIMLPGKDGLSICRELRASHSIPIIMLTARGDPTDRVVGLEIGADDYLAKPFDVRELEARIKAVLRRSPADAGNGYGQSPSVLVFAGWKLDLRQRQLHSPEGAEVELTTGEFGVLKAHGAHHSAQIQQLQAKDYAGEAQTWATMTRHMCVIADALADALAKQFPAKVRLNR